MNNTDNPSDKPHITSAWIPLDKIDVGPIRHTQLPNPVVERIDEVRRVFQEVFPKTLSEWVDIFKRDLDYERELLIWESMGQVFTNYCAVHRTTPGLRKEIHSAILTGTFSRGEEGIEHLNPKLLSRKDVFALWDAYDRIHAKRRKTHEGPGGATVL